MKKFRKITIAVLMASMVLALGACGRSNTPTAVVEKQMQQVKEEQMKTELSSLVSDKNVAKKYQKEYKELVEKIQDFDYEVKDEKVDGDAATVKVQITTYNFRTAYKEMYQQVVKDANSGKLTSKTDLNDYIYKMMFKKMNALKKKDYKKTVSIQCTKNEDGDWETDVDTNSDLKDAMLGGIMTLSSQNSTSSK